MATLKKAVVKMPELREAVEQRHKHEGGILQGLPGDDGYTPVKGVDYFDGLPGYTPVKGVDYFDGEPGEPGPPSTVPGPPGTTKFDELENIPSSFPPSAHGHAPSEIAGTAVVANDPRLSDARPPIAHNQTKSTISDFAHTHQESEVTGLTSDLTGKEPANSNIQTHVISTHAPSNAQKNSDITKAEIEAKLTGEISSHTHAGGGGGLGYALSVQALTSSPTDGQTIYFGTLPKAPVTAAGTSKIYIRKAGTIKIAEIYCYSGTAGTTETWSLYIRKNNSADTLIATLSVATNERVFSNAALSIAVAVGDYIEIKGVQPTWVTNPLTTIYGGYLYIE